MSFWWLKFIWHLGQVRGESQLIYTKRCNVEGHQGHYGPSNLVIFNGHQGHYGPAVLVIFRGIRVKRIGQKAMAFTTSDFFKLWFCFSKGKLK